MIVCEAGVSPPLLGKVCARTYEMLASAFPHDAGSRDGSTTDGEGPRASRWVPVASQSGSKSDHSSGEVEKSVLPSFSEKPGSWTPSL